ncbi:MAG: orotate phosphoribosyltransferase [Candidatus Thermoplasmatota archaeon]|nr:orotate phosphoribosyltransferase [Candidatus Thermoplasmatota archaeon]
MTVDASLADDSRRARLVDLVRDLSFLDGGSDDAFTLASGRTSRWFFDLKPAMMHPEAARLIGALICSRLPAYEADVVGGLELGAVPLTALVIANADAPDKLRGIMVRKEPKGRGGRKTNNPPGVEGSSLAGGGRIVVLEDVTTTGGSAVKAVERLRAETDCDVVGVISILDRQEGGAEAFAAAGIPFESLLVRSDIAG